jgi:hypothetical protein
LLRIIGVEVGFGLAGAAVSLGLYGAVVAFGAGIRTGALSLPALITQQVIVINMVTMRTNTVITTRTITMGLQRVPSEEDEVYWRRASRAMSEVVVLVIVIGSFLGMERTEGAGKVASAAIGNAAMIVGKSAYNRMKRAVCEGRGLIAMESKYEVGRSLEEKTGYETDLVLGEKESAKTLYVLQLYAAEKVSRCGVSLSSVICPATSAANLQHRLLEHAGLGKAVKNTPSAIRNRLSMLMRRRMRSE